MKPIKILEELCQRLRWVDQHPDVDLPHEHKRIAELLEMGKDDSDIAALKPLVESEDLAEALESAVKAYKARRDKPEEVRGIPSGRLDVSRSAPNDLKGA